MTRYDHDIDCLIVNELKRNGSLTCTQLYDSLKKPDERKKGIRYATVWEHLEGLSKPEIGILNKDGTPGPNNERRYSLTPATKFQLEYGIFDFEGVETKREDPARKQDTQARKYKKIQILLVLQAASGSSRYKIIEVDKKNEEKTKPKLLGTPFFPRNAKTGRTRYLEPYNEQGVTPKDIIKRRDHSHAGIFSHINFYESDVENCYNKWVKEDNRFAEVIGKDERQNGEIEFFFEREEIMRGNSIRTHFTISDLIMSCSALLSYVKSRVEETLKLDILLRSSSSIKKSSRQRQSHSHRRFMQKALDWYISSFGQRQYNRLYAITRVVQMKCRLDEDTFERLDVKASYDALQHRLSGEDKYNRLYDMLVKEYTPPVAESTRLRQRRRRGAEEKLSKEIQRIEEQIKLYDKAILTTYNCRVLCDKYEKEDEDNRRWLNKYYDFVRSILVDVVYPKFLRKEHKDNTELTKYVNSLPAPPAAINNKTTTTN